MTLHISFPQFKINYQGEKVQTAVCLNVCTCVYVRLVSVIKAEGVEEASSLVEPQRGNEKNKQPLPVPLWPEISNTLIPPTITTSARKEAQYPPSSASYGPENAQHESIRFYCPNNLCK